MDGDVTFFGLYYLVYGAVFGLSQLSDMISQLIFHYHLDPLIDDQSLAYSYPSQPLGGPGIRY